MRFFTRTEVDNPSKYKYPVLIACFLAFMFDNADMLVTSIGLPLLLDVFDITTAEGGAIATSMLIGAAIGSWFWGPMADRHGPRTTYVFCLSFYTVFTVACAFCNNLLPFLALRFCCGLALGGAWTIGVAYLSDFFPESQRGRAVGAVQSSAAVGMLFVVAVVKYLVPVFTWRALFFSAVLALPLIVFFACLPESPTWVKRRNAGQLKQSEKSKSLGLSFLFHNKKYRTTLLLAACLVVGIQVGNWGVTSWVPSYLVLERGLSDDAMSNTVALMYAGAFVGYWILGWAADRFGRRKTYIFISAFTFIATFVYMNLATDETVGIFAAVFGFGALGMFGPLGAFVCDTIPSEARGSGLGFVWGAGRLFAAAAPILLGSLATYTGLHFCIMLASVSYLVCFAASIFIKEVKEKPIEHGREAMQ